jgi:DNA-binding winged helix-turn-helix (wHTH) protein
LHNNLLTLKYSSHRVVRLRSTASNVLLLLLATAADIVTAAELATPADLK